jgi:hypothetical protein
MVVTTHICVGQNSDLPKPTIVANVSIFPFFLRLLGKKMVTIDSPFFRGKIPEKSF